MADVLVLIVILALAAVASRWFVTATMESAPATITVPAPLVPSPTHTDVPTWTPTATHTPTLTPTAVPTPSSTPTPVPPPAALPGPPVILTGTLSFTGTVTPQPLPVPSPMPLLEQPEAVINVLLLGSDQSSAGGLSLTDVIVVVSVDPDAASVSLLSIPRDFYAWIPGYGFDKINTAHKHGEREGYPGGGMALLKATIEYNLGIRIHYYAWVGFDGFAQIVDALGGVDVAVECALSDTFPDADAPEGQTDVDWLPGIQHLDGKHALWYVRSRWSTHDLDRNRRQQQVLRGLYRRALDAGMIPRIPELWEVLREAVETDVGLSELLYLAGVGVQLDPANVKSAFVGQTVLQVWTAPNGAWVLVPYYEMLGPFVAEALAPPASGRAQQRPFRVEVWNGSAEEGLGHVAAERLRWEGFEVTNVARVGQDDARTQIWDFTTTSKGSPLPRLMYLYARYAGDVTYQPAEEREVDFRVILGADYDPCVATRVYRPPDAPPTPTPLPTVVRE